MKVADQIHQILTKGLNPIEIQVVDKSHLHVGHAGARPDGESHFMVRVVSPSFAGLNRVARHRMVNDLLSELLKERVHALSLQLFSPGEV